MTQGTLAVVEPVIVNTGPLIALGICDQVELLHSMHPRVIVPDVVAAEFARGPSAGRARTLAPYKPWLEVVRLRTPVPPLLHAHLDDGEASVIALAVELKVPRVIIDERRARIVARTFGLAVTGTVGVLLRAKKLGLLPAIKPCLESMREHHVWLSQRLLESALREAGEQG